MVFSFLKKIIILTKSRFLTKANNKNEISFPTISGQRPRDIETRSSLYCIVMYI